MNEIFILLGSNLGNRMGYLHQAQDLLNEALGKVESISKVYETAPWGSEPNQPHFLNQAIKVKSKHTPTEALLICQQTEKILGRYQHGTDAPRTVDIDIIYFNNRVINLPMLYIPHPKLAKRRFALTPLAGIAPDFVHPQLGKTNTQLLAACTDTLDVHEYVPYNKRHSAYV